MWIWHVAGKTFEGGGGKVGDHSVSSILTPLYVKALKAGSIMGLAALSDIFWFVCSTFRRESMARRDLQACSNRLPNRKLLCYFRMRESQRDSGEAEGKTNKLCLHSEVPPSHTHTKMESSVLNQPFLSGGLGYTSLCQKVEEQPRVNQLDWGQGYSCYAPVTWKVKGAIFCL